MQRFYRIFGRCLPGLVRLSLLTNCQVRENLISSEYATLCQGTS